MISIQKLENLNSVYLRGLAVRAAYSHATVH